jgi:battenin
MVAFSRNTVGFFVAGLSNNASYSFFLSAAKSLLSSDGIPAAVVLLADILPTLVMKVIAPMFLLHRLSYRTTVIFCSALSLFGFQLACWGASATVILLGVILASFSTGLGECTFLAMSHHYPASAVSAWSSGTGAAGLVASWVFSFETALLRLPTPRALLFNSWIPLLVYVSAEHIMQPVAEAPNGTRSHSTRAGQSYVPLRSSQTVASRKVHASPVNTPNTPLLDDSELSPSPLVQSHAATEIPAACRASLAYAKSHADQLGADCGIVPKDFISSLTVAERLTALRPILVPVAELYLVYTAEYVLNQGVAPYVSYPESTVSDDVIYTTLQSLYQFGVFISRSSTALFLLPVQLLALPPLVQLVLLALGTANVLTHDGVYPSLWILYAMTVLEGLLGGTAYAHNFAHISRSSPHLYREFRMGVASVGDALGITTAAFLDLVWDKWLCAV